MVRVLIVDERGPVYDLAKATLTSEPDITVIGCATTREQALHLAAFGDVAIINARADNINAPRVVSGLISEYPEIRVLVAGLDEETDSGIEQIVQFLEAGAFGYMTKAESMEWMLAKIRAAYDRQALLSPPVAARIMVRIAELSSLREERGIPADGGPSNFTDLTPREQEVLQLVASGLSNREIADHLFIKEGTVKSHVHHILDKLAVDDRYAAAALYKLTLQNQHNFRARGD